MKNNLRSNFLAILFVVFLMNFLVVVWLLYVANSSPTISITQSEPPHITLLCPGETFTYTFFLETDKAASIDLNYSVVPALDRNNSRMVTKEQIYLDRPVSLVLTRNWLVPDLVPLITGEEFEWESTRYHRSVQVNLSSGNIIQGEVNYPFVIKNHCP